MNLGSISSDLNCVMVLFRSHLSKLLGFLKDIYIQNSRNYINTAAYKLVYSETCILKPSLGQEKCALYFQVHFREKKRTDCSEIGGLRIEVVRLHIQSSQIQVSLYFLVFHPYNKLSTCLITR